ncbi:hypothetical protein F5X96DRAFT_15837 [Biscogniauxia mediterranea]|nr:hypothetical protein F5X96DRAFT_15837 [Biscogniauxia mediterranea]
MTTTTLGKRKSRTQKADPPVSQEDAMAIFRRHFEAQFKPLAPSEQSTKTAASAPEAEDMRSDSEDDTSNGSWDGVSDEDGEDEEEESDSSPPSSSNAPTTAAAEVEVVSHTPTPTTSLLRKLSKRETKAYLSSRPPPTTTTSSTTSSSTSKRKPAPTTADEDAPSLVKNDLALQRLLSESHLLASSSSSSPAETEHAGRNRHLATDLRVAALGARQSIYAQAKMPMAVRKGIAAAAAGREAKRRREARENGIVLERPGSGGGLGLGLGLGGKGKKGVGGGGGGGRRRERPVDAPAVGRLGGATLRLSKRDIAEIEAEGPRGRGGGAGKRRRR